MSIDLLSNMTSAIKNATLVGKSHVELPFSNECEAVLKVMKKEGYIEGVKSFKEKGKAYKKLRVDLAYENDVSKIDEIQRVSKPGNRKYKKSTEIGKALGGFGLLIVSTNRGVMSGAEARKKKLGGEVLCLVY